MKKVRFGQLGLTTLLALLMVTKTFAGAIGGPWNVRSGELSPKGSAAYTFVFRTDERARVRAVGTTDIDLYVYDEDGKLITKDELKNNRPSISWDNATFIL